MTKETFSTNHRYAVIIAGGNGTRLWPMSRKNAPKQFQKILGDQTLVQVMYEMLNGLLPEDHIFVLVDERFRHFLVDQLPKIPKENILIEPEARDTGPAVGLATAYLLNRDPEARVGVFWSDHVIKNPEVFQDALQTAYQSLEDFPEHIVSIGIKPSHPHIGMGYIQMQNEAKHYETGEVFYVEKFLEKPDLKTAQRFVKSWEYLWNTGYSVFRAEHFFKLIAQFDKETAAIFQEIRELLKQGADLKKITPLFGQLPKLSIDYLVMEKTKDMLVVPADLEWADVGDWRSLHAIMAEIRGHHMVVEGDHVGIDCENCLVYGGERLVTTVGLKDIVIVDTGDALLVAHRDAVQGVKSLVKELEDKERHAHL